MAFDQTTFSNSIDFISSVEPIDANHSNCPPLFRYLRLQSLPQLTRWIANSEPGKVAVHRTRRIAFFSLLLHAIPLTAVVALIVLNTRVTYIGTVNNHNTLDGALQVVAKCLELLIQASLGNMLLNITRNELLAAAPFPLGGLLAPYRITDITYLWSREFWGAATSNCFRSSRKIAFIALISFMMVLAATVGPANAVAMIPRFVEIPVTESLVISSTDDSQVLYPRQITLNGSQLNNEDDIKNSIYQFREIAMVPTSPIIDPTGIRNLYWRKLASDNLGAQIPARDFTWSQAATIATQAASHAIGTSILFEGNMGHLNALQPYVVSNRHGTSVNNTPAALQNFVSFGTGDHSLDSLFRYADTLQNITCRQSASGLNFTKMSNMMTASSLSWFDLGSLRNGYSIASISTSYSVTGNAVHGSAGAFGDSGGYDTYACVHNATWRMTETNMSRDTLIVSGGDLDRDNGGQEFIPINIDLEWVRRLTDLLAGNQSHADYYNLSFFLASPLALAIADAASVDPRNYDSFGTNFGSYTTPRSRSRLSTEQYDSMLRFITEEKLLHKYSRVTIWDQSANWSNPSTLQSFIVSNSFYGYGYDSSVTMIRLALAALCSYVALVVFYVTYIMITGRTATSWDSIGELFMLALNSRQPDHPSDTSVDVETLATYRRPTNVRVNRKTTLTELILEDDSLIDENDYEKVQPNKRYW